MYMTYLGDKSMKNKTKVSALFILLALATLTACGGGGGSTPPHAPKAWGTAVLIETDNASSANEPQIAIDANGNALVVWYKDDGTTTRSNIWANRYTAGSGWGTAMLIESDDGSAYSPQIGFDANGNALAMWTQHDGSRNNIVANLYTSGLGWGAATVVSNSAGAASDPQLAFDTNGNALAVWRQENGSGKKDIWANRYTAGSGWGTAGLIETEAGTANEPQIAFDRNGNALAVWYQDDFTTNNIWANRYTAGSGWGTAALIEADNAGDASSPQIAFDGDGNALAVWCQFDGTRDNMWANRYTVGSGWGTAGLIETDNAGSAAEPQIAIDNNGSALAVWSQYDGTRNNIWANRYSAGLGWGTAVLIETDNAGYAFQPQLAYDKNGDAQAVWAQYDGTLSNIWGNRYSAGSGWGMATLIETDNAGDAATPQISFDTNGNPLAVWAQMDGTRYNIWANRFQ